MKPIPVMITVTLILSLIALLVGSEPSVADPSLPSDHEG